MNSTDRAKRREIREAEEKAERKRHAGLIFLVICLPSVLVGVFGTYLLMR